MTQEQKAKAYDEAQLPANLNEAAEKYALKTFPKEEGKVFHSYFGTIEFDKNASMRTGAITGFIAGAKWMAEQGVSYETELGWEIDGDRAFPELDPPVEDLLMPSDISLNFNDGDKVIVQIRKAE